jgi:transcriptional regulator with XRE-family HTH domain
VANTQPTLYVGRHSSEVPTISLRDFGDLLKRYREDRGLTQAEAAATVEVSRATFAQWETGRHLPAEERVHQLDEYLVANGELTDAAGQARGLPRPRPLEPSDVGAPPTKSLAQVLLDVRGALVDQLCHDEQGRPAGWRHNLVPSDDPPTALSTAFGLGALAVLPPGPDPGVADLTEAVLAKAVRDGDRIVGWAASVQRAPRLESTAMLLDALMRVGVTFKVDDVLRIVGDLFDDTARQRPFVLTTALRPLLYVAPDAGLTHDVVDALLECRVDFDGVRIWPEKSLTRDQPLLEPSAAHTAHAVTMLRNASGAASADAVAEAEQWLTRTEDFNGISEIIRRDLGDGRREELTIHHFTSAWVVRALAGAAVPPRGRIERALTHVWERYDPNLHLWAWGNGDVPAWMLVDSVMALVEAALALQPTPIEPDSS